MPIYEFTCANCGELFEEIATSSEDNKPCPKCGNPNAVKVLSAPSSLTGKDGLATPDAHGHGCCGSSPSSKGCVPGTCCGRAGH